MMPLDEGETLVSSLLIRHPRHPTGAQSLEVALEEAKLCQFI